MSSLGHSGAESIRPPRSALISKNGNCNARAFSSEVDNAMLEVASEGGRFLPKPYSPAEIAKILREVIVA
jgi:hypothetical protein